MTKGIKTTLLFLRVPAAVVAPFGFVLAMLNLGVALLGGPREPPSDMTWDEFMIWKQSGAWANEAIYNALVFFLFPALIFILCTVLLRRQKRISNKQLHPIHDPPLSAANHGRMS